MVNETILLVDDNADLLDLLGNGFLAPLGYRVLTAYNGEEGLIKVINEEPDLIVLDMNMPQMTGIEMLLALRELDHHPPVIFMTVEGSEAVAVQAFRLGASNYLSKPFSGDEFIQAVDDALRETRLKREKETLEYNLLAVNTVQQTVITLSHHLNNHLMIASGSLTLLTETLANEPHLLHKEDIDEMVRSSSQSIKQIKQVLETLQQLNKIEPTTYHDNAKMLNLPDV